MSRLGTSRVAALKMFTVVRCSEVDVGTGTYRHAMPSPVYTTNRLLAVVFNKKSPAEAGVNVGSEDDLFCHGVPLVPSFLVDVDVANLLHLVDEFVDCNAVRYVEEQV